MKNESAFVICEKGQSFSWRLTKFQRRLAHNKKSRIGIKVVMILMNELLYELNENIYL
jgi:hypothetical protein